MQEFRELAKRYCDSASAEDALFNELSVLFNSINSSNKEKLISATWDAATKFTLQELGEICKGDNGYIDKIEDKETFIKNNLK